MNGSHQLDVNKMLIPVYNFYQLFNSDLSVQRIEFLSGLSTNFLWILIVFVTTYYLLHDGPALRNWLVRLAPMI